ncbi:MAG: sulfatase, partial [Wenzhouxiangellaceae bacterium]|nr:sulfatase [Wenzhouxiangellaceae bacterium]
MSRMILVLLTAVLLTACGSDAGDERPPDIVLVSIDTLRADRVAGYGYPEMLTPNVDAMVRQGVVFEHAVATTGTTWPSHASMLTGLYPRYHGVRSNTHALDENVRSVAELLERAGYATGSFVSFKGMHFLAGLDRGFTTASDRERSPRGAPAIRDGRETTDMALNWLDEQAASEQPVFMWLHLFEPHGPYDPTDYSRRWMAETGYDGLLAENGATMDLLLKQTQAIVAGDRDREALNVLYDGEVLLADRYFGEILEKLDRTGRLDNAVVVFTSDHGQGLGEQERMGHGPVLWEEVLQVPLVVRDYRSTSRPRRVAETVSLADIAPTVAELALGVRLPGTQGVSLAPALAGEPIEPREILAEVALQPPDQVGDWYDPDALAVYTQGLKFVFRNGSVRAFEVGRKAAEVRPIGGPDANPALAEFAGSVAEEFLAGEMATSDAELTESDIEALRSLG